MSEVTLTKAKQAYTNPTERIFGDGAFAELPKCLAKFQPKSILLVLGEKSFRQSSYYSKCREFVEAYSLIEASPVSQNPTQKFIQEEINRLSDKGYDLVLAIGGGSVLDVSKLLASVPKQKNRDLSHYLAPGYRFETKPAPIIAVPTTSGTGSEVTPYASIETLEKKKITISDLSFYPAVAIIDPELSYSMPAYVTASTGFDALSQAVESFWSVHATSFSETHALRAIDLIVSSLEQAYENPTSPAARRLMALGSCEAGLAIAQTKTTAVHSVSYPITAHFGVAHGHACALTLGEFIRFNADHIQNRKLLYSAFKLQDENVIAAKVESLMESVKLERSLSKLGIDEEGRTLILQEGFRPDRIANNPRKVERDDLVKILENIR